MIPWYYAAAIALGTFTLGAWAGYRRGYLIGTITATLKAAGFVFDGISRNKP